MARPVSLLFDNAASPSGAQIYFANPVGEIRADGPEQVDQALAAVDTALKAGRWIAGYLSYELGYALEPRLKGLTPSGGIGPLARLFVFDGPSVAPRLPSSVGCRARTVDAEAQWPAYRRAFDRAHRYILDGDIYQVNLTFPLRAEVTGDPAGLYASLRTQARAGASALLQLGDEDILSFSPETFFTVRGARIAARPMKGTASRGLTATEDLRAKRALRADPKERAENLMIVDLLRNDLARIAAPGSVRVTDLFTVETFPRLHTMTSGISADLEPGACFSDILRALFPCGSITGAPKIRAMEIIRELETMARGPYCGAIGFAGPGVAAFNVAIRTLTIRDGSGVLPVGSGVVSDSVADREFRECLLKAQFLSRPAPDFHLLETVRWSRSDGVSLDAEHYERFADSATYFGFSFSPVATAAALDIAAKESDAELARVRLELRTDGGVEARAIALPFDATAVWRYEIAQERIHSMDPFRHHKTTHRGIYDDALAAARARGLDELIFLNERGEVAEGAISNVFVELNGQIVTPPLSSGALNGCLRRAALDIWPDLAERVLTPADLARADSVWFGNSVRGFVRGVKV